MSLNKISQYCCRIQYLPHYVSAHVIKFGNMLDYRHEPPHISFIILKMGTPFTPDWGGCKHDACSFVACLEEKKGQNIEAKELRIVSPSPILR